MPIPGRNRQEIASRSMPVGENIASNQKTMDSIVHVIGKLLKIVVGKAEKLGIELVFLPPYSPKYNPIEQIWKTVKREISKAHLILDLDELYWLIRDVFLGECLSGNYADAWKSDFLSENLRNRISLSMVS